MPIIEPQMSADIKSRITNHESRTTNRGFTLLETLIVLLLLSVLLGVSGYLFVVSLRAWDAGRLRTGIREDINYAMEKMVRDLRQTACATLIPYNPGSGEIAHAIQFSKIGADTYVLYLYNAGDPAFDSTYSEHLYELRQADITAGDNPTYGEGVLLLRDVVSPDASEPATDLTIEGREVTLNLVVQRADETVNIRTIVRPRNL